MRTIAVFYTGSDMADPLWYCELDDLGGVPSVGTSFVYAHCQYEVTKAVGCLGARNNKGELRTGTEKLLELLNTLFGDEKALGLYARLTNIGSGDAPTVTAGGITLPTASLAGDFQNVVLCYVKAVGSSTKRKERSFPGLLQAVARLHEQRGADTVSDLPAAGLPRIRLTAGKTRAASRKGRRSEPGK